MSHSELQARNARRRLTQAREKHAKAETGAAKKESEAARYQQSASRSNSESTVRMKLGQAERAAKKAGDLRKDAAKHLTDAAQAERDLANAQQKIAREQEQDRKRAEQKQRERDKRAERERQRRQREDDSRSLRQQTEVIQLRAQVDAMARAEAPEQIKVLFIAASPEDQEPIRLDREMREIQQRLRSSEYRDAIAFEARMATQVGDLMEAINETSPDIVHFSGHGSEDSLVFETGRGHSRAVSSQLLAELISHHEGVRLVIFNSCDSSPHAEAVCEFAPAAIGMRASIGDEAAKEFAGQFYSALGYGKSLQEAFDQAVTRVRLMLDEPGDEPEIFTADEADASHIYLVVPQHQAALT